MTVVLDPVVEHVCEIGDNRLGQVPGFINQLDDVLFFQRAE